MEDVRRAMSQQLAELHAEEQVIVLQGPRAVGKTTLLRAFHEQVGGSFVDLADDTALGVARLDPAGYLDGLASPVLIDEFQRLPELVPVVKRTVDLRRQSGQFVLTGSTTSSLMPRGTETMTGRSHDLTVWGFSQGELSGRFDDFIARAFDDPQSLRKVRSDEDRAGYAHRVARGGFPEAVRREREAARHRWHLDYARRVVDRDLADLVRLRAPGLLRNVLRAAAARTGQVTNLNDLANDLTATRQTVASYIELLERIFLVDRLPAWSRNFSTRIAKHPKLHMTDSGLATSLLNLNTESLRRHPQMGPLTETFVVNELRKQRGWSTLEVELFHFRHRDGQEVDIVLEDRDGRVVGIEVNSATSVELFDAKGLRFLADGLGDDFVHGFVLYAGSSPIRLGDDRLSAIPISSLWTGPALKTTGRVRR